jgi:NTP pyrophosphatase (non-canonical NTP hydrolase)
VPGTGWIGDATVATIDKLTSVKIAVPGVVGALPAHIQVTDALSIAQAQEHAPFDAGSLPLDATVPGVVFNWHGQRVVDLATTRLMTVYGDPRLPDPNRFGTVHVPARDALASPPSFAALASITARLRRPDGCPWDREQTHESLLADFASEVEEYAEAVRSGNWLHAAEELGDVLLNILMQTQIGTEEDHFKLEDVLTSINAKLVRRHPHVFAGVEATSPEDVLAVWNSVKQAERRIQSSDEDSNS